MRICSLRLQSIETRRLRFHFFQTLQIPAIWGFTKIGGPLIYRPQIVGPPHHMDPKKVPLIPEAPICFNRKISERKAETCRGLRRQPVRDTGGHEPARARTCCEPARARAFCQPARAAVGCEPACAAAGCEQAAEEATW